MTPLTPEELADPVHPYVRIHQDGTVVAYSNQTEMGQGAHTTLALIVAEELDADFASVRVVSAANGVGPQGDVYGTPAGGGFIQLTGASTGTKGFLGPLPPGRRPGAGRGWPPPRPRPGACRPKKSSSSRARCATPAGSERASATLRRARPRNCRSLTTPRPKDPGRYQLVGTEGRLRVDSPGKILGQTRFTIDVTLPGDADRGGAAPAPSSAPHPPRSMTARRSPSPASPR